MPSFRKQRVPSQPMTGANIRIRQGLFGALANVEPGISGNSIYSFFQGYVITAGQAQTAVFEPNFELPLITVWGKGVIRNPNTFFPKQPQQLFNNPIVLTNALGGPIAGQIALQPLLSNENGSL